MIVIQVSESNIFVPKNLYFFVQKNDFNRSNDILDCGCANCYFGCGDYCGVRTEKERALQPTGCLECWRQLFKDDNTDGYGIEKDCY